jgi:phospholipase C
MPAAMPQIDKIVLLMLENRSIDNVLGWLYEGAELPPERLYPPGSSPRFDGIPLGAGNRVGTRSYAPRRGTQDLRQPLRQPRWNPNELWENTGNQCYWDGDGNDAVPRWSPTAAPPMTGFARDYARWYDAVSEVMGAYTSDQLPVLYGLAESFAVSDAWFSSVPTESNPNRAFGLCGSSQGAVDNADTSYYQLPTVLNALGTAPQPKSWTVYWQYNGCLDMDPRGDGATCFTVDVFPWIRRAVERGEGRAAHWNAFFEAAAAGTLPDVSFIEPFSTGGYGLPWGTDFVGLQGNDYHAPGWVGQAEWDLNRVYEALRDSPHWEKTLLVITFDEHGGTWDHVPPPPAVPPDDQPSLRDFAFDRMGVRVPAILVSPWVTPGSVFRAPPGAAYPYDHTSVINTVLRWAGIDPATAGFGARVAAAPSFHEVLGDTFHDNRPDIAVPAHYETMGGPKGPHNVPFGIGRMRPLDFRRIEAESTSHSDFLHRLRREAGTDGRSATARAADWLRTVGFLTRRRVQARSLRR